MYLKSSSLDWTTKKKAHRKFPRSLLTSYHAESLTSNPELDESRAMRMLLGSNIHLLPTILGFQFSPITP